MNTAALSAAQCCADAATKTIFKRFSVVLEGHYGSLRTGCPKGSAKFTHGVVKLTLGRCASLDEVIALPPNVNTSASNLLAQGERCDDGQPFQSPDYFNYSLVTVYDLRGHKVLIGEIGRVFGTMYWFEPAVSSDEIRSLSEAARNLYLAADYQHGRGDTSTAMRLRERAGDLLRHRLVSRPWAALARDALKEVACYDPRKVSKVKAISIVEALREAEQAFQEQYEMPVTKRYFGFA